MPTPLTFEQIVHDHQAMVFRTLARLLGPNAQQALLEDLAQDVFLRLFRALPNFRGDALITTYLYRIALNVAQNEWKRRRRDDKPGRHLSLSDDEAGWESRIPHPGATALEQLEESEFAQIVDDQLQLLSTAERAVLVLYHQEDQSYDQIALTLNLPIGTVRTHLHRGRRKLREALQQHTALSSRGIPA